MKGLRIENNSLIGRSTRDWNISTRWPRRCETGPVPIPPETDGGIRQRGDILGNRFAAINRMVRTEDDYKKIGTLFDFRILVRTERTCEGDMQALQNKFMVEGLTVSNIPTITVILQRPKLAVMNFINALERAFPPYRENGAGKRGAVEGHPGPSGDWRLHGPSDAEIKRAE